MVAAAWWLRSQPVPPGPCSLAHGRVALPDLPEASGLALSRRTPGLIWSHNDSGNAEVLVALDASGAVRGRVRLPVRTVDWEDLSAAPCPSGDCLYIADIGDNGLSRARVMLHRVPEPLPTEPQTAVPDTFSLTYGDGPHNAEAAFVRDEWLFVVTKDRDGGLYRSTARLGAGADVTLERIGELGLETVSDAEASPDGAFVVVRTPREAALYRADELARGTITPVLRVSLAALGEPQGEGIAIDAAGTLYLAGEGRPWTGGGTLTAIRCPRRE